MSTKFSLRLKANRIQALNPTHGSTSNYGNSAWPQSQNSMWAKTSSKSHQPRPEIWAAFCSLCTSPPSTTDAVTDDSSLTGRRLIFLPFHHFKGFTDWLYQLCLWAWFQPSSLLRKSSYSYTIKFKSTLPPLIPITTESGSLKLWHWKLNAKQVKNNNNLLFYVFFI